MDDDRRRFPRLSERSRLTWRLADDAPAVEQGLAINISGGGLRFETDTPPPKGALLALELKLPELPSAVIALGRVVWSEPGGEVGVEFHWVGWDSGVAQAQIAGYIRDRLSD